MFQFGTASIYENLRTKNFGPQIEQISQIVRGGDRDYLGAGVESAFGFDGIGVG
jgi:hypothetical protein